MNTVLDVKGLLCPLPVLKARKAMKSLAQGDVIIVEATDPAAAIDIPHFCHEAGHTLVDQAQKDDVLIFTIQRGE